VDDTTLIKQGSPWAWASTRDLVPRGRSPIGTRAEQVSRHTIRSKVSGVHDRPTQRLKQVGEQAKGFKHTKMKNEYEMATQSLVPRQSVNVPKNLQVQQKMIWKQI